MEFTPAADDAGLAVANQQRATEQLPPDSRTNLVAFWSRIGAIAVTILAPESPNPTGHLQEIAIPIRSEIVTAIAPIHAKMQTRFVRENRRNCS